MDFVLFFEHYSFELFLSTIALSYFGDTETASRWEKLQYAAHKHVDPRPVKPEG